MARLGEKRPVVIYDGDCPLCRNIVRGWRWLGGRRAEFTPYQQMAEKPPGITTRDLSESVHLIEPDGEVYKGAQAVFRLLAHRPGLGWLPWLYRHAPGFAWVSERVYRWVARHRRRL